MTGDLFAGLDAMPEAESRLALWLVLNSAVSPYRALIRRFGSAQHALAADWSDLGLHESHLKRIQQWHRHDGTVKRLFDRVIAGHSQQEFSLIFEDDPAYPALLKQISDAPPFLWLKGNPACLNQPQLGIVGTRKPSPSGRKLAYDFARALAQEGLWITSGLAHGIDAEAHHGALAAGGGRTVAVMATGVDLCYPDVHRKLYDQIIAEGGAVISEFAPGTPPLAYQFPRRNRLISGLALGTLVVEAALKSGSLITAKLALEQNRDIFAIPGHVHNAQSMGCLELIRQNGAQLVYEPSHILDALQLPTARTLNQTDIPHLSEEDKKAPEVPSHLAAVWQRLDWTGLTIDELVEQSDIPVAELTGQLMELELLGLAVQQAGRYQRCRV